MALSIRLVSARSMSCKSPSNSRGPGRTAQSDGRWPIGQIVLLHGIRHQLVESETLAVQHLIGGLQGSEFEELLRQSTHFVTLRQCSSKYAIALLRFDERLSCHRFEVAMKRRERGPHIMRNAGHHLAMRTGLLLFASSLRLDTLRHLVKRRTDRADLVTVSSRLAASSRSCLQGAHAVVAHAIGQTVQGQGQPVHGEKSEQQRHQQASCRDESCPCQTRRRLNCPAT